MTRLRKGISWTYCIGVQCVLAVVASPDPVFPGVPLFTPSALQVAGCNHKIRLSASKGHQRDARGRGVVGMDDWWVLSLFGLLRGFSSGG